MNYNEQNAHSRDASIEFDEASHTYTVGGRVFNTVTTLVEDCFKKLDVDYWAERKATPSCTKEMILAQWDAKGKEARELGTKLHDRIERHYLGIECDEECKDRAFTHFLTFAKENHLRPYRSEWRIFIEDCGLAGTLDFLAVTEDGSYEIWDWKRSNKVVDSCGSPNFNSYGKKALAPIDHLPDTMFHHYALQVSIYRYILAEKYGIETRAGRLGIFHPDYSRPWVVELPYLRPEVISLLFR